MAGCDVAGRTPSVRTNLYLQCCGWLRLFTAYAKRTYKHVSLMLLLVATFHSVRKSYVQIRIFNVVVPTFHSVREAYVQIRIFSVVAGCDFSQRTPGVGTESYP